MLLRTLLYFYLQISEINLLVIVFLFEYVFDVYFSLKAAIKEII